MRDLVHNGVGVDVSVEPSMPALLFELDAKHHCHLLELPLRHLEGERPELRIALLRQPLVQR